VVGTLNTVAAYGAPVTFAVTKQPTNGTVAIDPQGFYTYTPNADKAASGFFDSFTVTAIDGRIHLENFLGLPGHATTMTVPVNWTPTPAIPDSAPTPRTQAQTSYPTYTYTVVNNSWATQTFGAGAYRGKVLAFPAAGTELLTGQSADYRVRAEQVPGTEINQQLVSGGSGTVAGTLTWDPNAPLDIYDIAGAGYVAICRPTAGSCGVPTGNGGSINLFDAPGTVYAVSSANAQQQSNILQNLVADDLSNATFHPKSQPTIGYTDPRRVPGYSYTDTFDYNNGVNYIFTASQTKTQTNSYQYQVSVNESEEAKLAALTAKAAQIATQTWGTTTEDSLTYTQTLTYTPSIYADPNYQETLYLYTATPVYRFYGDWSVVYGNTTYLLTDVWIDSPNPVTDQYPGYLKAYTCDQGSSACRPLAAGNVPDRNSWPGSPNYPVGEPSSATVSVAYSGNV
jgi:hypothetical protein